MKYPNYHESVPALTRTIQQRSPAFLRIMLFVKFTLQPPARPLPPRDPPRLQFILLHKTSADYMTARIVFNGNALDTGMLMLFLWEHGSDVPTEGTKRFTSLTQMCYEFVFQHISKVVLTFEDIHNSWSYCFTNPLELETRVSLSHRQPYFI